jgi:hypothetical protein
MNHLFFVVYLYNKGITVEYNYLNLPTSVQWADGRSIQWFYSGTGEKLCMASFAANGTLDEVMDYAGGLEYKTAGVGGAFTLMQAPMSEGRVRYAGGVSTYEYFMKDHLGNVRFAFQPAATGFDVVKTQENHYYPFGMTVKLNNYGEGNKYLYNGKELIDKFDLSWYHYGARWY